MCYPHDGYLLFASLFFLFCCTSLCLSVYLDVCTLTVDDVLPMTSRLDRLGAHFRQEQHQASADVDRGLLMRIRSYRCPPHHAAPPSSSSLHHHHDRYLCQQFVACALCCRPYLLSSPSSPILCVCAQVW
jgi:hypothetical protein